MAVVDVSLCFALGGQELRSWRNVPANTLLHDLLGNEIERIPGTVEVVQGGNVISDMGVALSSFGVGMLTLSVVRTHGQKIQKVLFTPYVSTEGGSAVKVDEMSVYVPFPISQHERFYHVLEAMEAAFGKEIGYKGKLIQMIREDLPGEVRRRKLQRFIKGGTISGVFVFDGSCDVSLRMEVSRFAIQDPNEHALGQMRNTVGVIKELRDAECA